MNRLCKNSRFTAFDLIFEYSNIPPAQWMFYDVILECLMFILYPLIRTGTFLSHSAPVAIFHFIHAASTRARPSSSMLPVEVTLDPREWPAYSSSTSYNAGRLRIKQLRLPHILFWYFMRPHGHP
ncbi:hypothetical protein RB195_019178 [Necator americanus]|uniref:Uncharacterized protein n=1 Tax=Necator americanus TaxID=51031 RepID=A0ABR1CCY5_NECAM